MFPEANTRNGVKNCCGNNKNIIKKNKNNLCFNCNTFMAYSTKLSFVNCKFEGQKFASFPYKLWQWKWNAFSYQRQKMTSKTICVLFIVYLSVCICQNENRNTDESVAIRIVLGNERLLKMYLDCLLDVGMCTKEGLDLKSKNSTHI